MDLNEQAYNVALGAEMMDGSQEMPEQDNGQEIDKSIVVDDEIVSMVTKRKEASRSWKEAKKQIWDQCWNHYKQVYNRTNKAAWQMTTFIPASPKVAEVIAANMHAALLSPENPVEYQARRPEFERQVKDVNDLIASDSDHSDFKVHWTDILRTICVIGTGIGKIEYKKETAIVRIKERLKQLPGMDMMRRMLGLPPAPTETITEKQMLVKDYACTRNVDPYNFFPEPGSVDIDKNNWCIEEGKICNYKLIELSQDPDNPIRNVNDDILMSNPRDLRNPDSQEKEAAQDEPIKPTAYMDPDQEHILDEYWGPVPIWMVNPELYGDESKKYQMVNAWIWVIDGKYVVRCQLSPFRDAEPPYVKGVYIPVPGQFWGIGPLELMLGLQVELNEIRNTRMDNINILLNKVVAVIKSAISVGDYDRLVSDPGKIWLFDNIDDIKKAIFPIEFPDVTQDSWRSSSEIYNEIQEVTAANKATIGSGGGTDQAGGDTFRGQLLNKQTSGERFLMYAKTLEKTGMSKAYQKMYQRIYQYKGFEQVAEILGPERAQTFEFVEPERLDKMARVVPMGVTNMENKGIQLAQMAEEYKILANEPFYKKVEAARRMVVARGQSDPSSVIMTDEELAQLNEMRRQMMSDALPTSGNNQPPFPGQSSPIAGNVPGPTDGQPQPAMPPRGPGASSIDGQGMPL